MVDQPTLSSGITDAGSHRPTGQFDRCVRNIIARSRRPHHHLEKSERHYQPVHDDLRAVPRCDPDHMRRKSTLISHEPPGADRDISIGLIVERPHRRATETDRGNLEAAPLRPSTSSTLQARVGPRVRIRLAPAERPLRTRFGRSTLPMRLPPLR